VSIVFVKTCPDVSTHDERRGEFRHLIPRRDFWTIALLWTLATAASLAIYNILPLFLVNERGIPLNTANTILGFSRIGGVFAGLIAGFLTDRYGVKKIMILLMGAMGVFTVMLAFVRPFPLLAGVLLLQATFAPAFFPVGFVAVSKLTTINERSIFMGSTIAFASSVGLGFTTPLLGLIADLRNFQTGIAILGFLVILSCFTLRGFPKI
jgi:NNP family nitrate/nitrite transporter-like MFS transporter